MYVGVSFRCGPEGEELGTQSRGGTQNILPGERVTLENRILLTPPRDGVISCEVSASTPYDDIPSVGTRLPLIAQWEATRVDGSAKEAVPGARLPTVIAPGARQYAFTQWLPADEVVGRRIDLLSSLHLTTCTGVNGSNEDGTTWCAPGTIDVAGSRYQAEARLDVVDADGRACQSLGNSQHGEPLTRARHHRLLPLEAGWEIPAELCGDRVRATVVVENDGPAPLVVHRSNSSMITLIA